jgi:hypothetical protein
MAQSGYTPILIYASGTATNVPLAADLTSSANGAELALNYADGKLYYKNSSGVVTLLASTATVAPVTTISFGSTGLTPATATSGAVTVAGTLAVANGGTGVTTSTGTGSVVLSAAPTLTGNPVISSTGAVTLPVGTTGQQPSGVTGMLRFNSTTTSFEGYNGTVWTSVGGITLADDTTTNATRYPLFAAATSGAVTTEYVSSTKLNYNPSSGEFTSPEIVSSNGLIVNGTTVSTNYTVATGNNAFSVGPITVASGAAVTVSSGQRWIII